MSFSTEIGSISWNKRVQPAPLSPSIEAPCPGVWHFHLCCWSSSKEESSQRHSEGPNLLAFQPWPKPARGTSGEPLLEEVIQKPRWPGGPPWLTAHQWGNCLWRLRIPKLFSFLPFSFFSFSFLPSLGGTAEHQGCPETCVSHHWLQQPPWRTGEQRRPRGNKPHGAAVAVKGGPSLSLHLSSISPSSSTLTSPKSIWNGGEKNFGSGRKLRSMSLPVPLSTDEEADAPRREVSGLPNTP